MANLHRIQDCIDQFAVLIQKIESMSEDSIKMSSRPAIGAENVDGRFQWIMDNVPMKWDKELGRLEEADV